MSNKSKKLKITSHINGQVIRNKHGSVTIVINTRAQYHDMYYNIDAIELVVDKSVHPVWAIKKILRKS